MEVRNITYYKTIKPVIFNDGFEVPVGTKVQFNFSEGQIFNVELKKQNEKRIFWVHSSDLEFFKTIKEKWLKKDIEEHNIDLNDKWFEHEKKRMSQSKDKARNREVKISDSKRKASKSTTKSTTKSNRTGNQVGVPVKKRKTTTESKRTKTNVKKSK